MILIFQRQKVLMNCWKFLSFEDVFSAWLDSFASKVRRNKFYFFVCYLKCNFFFSGEKCKYRKIISLKLIAGTCCLQQIVKTFWKGYDLCWLTFHSPKNYENNMHSPLITLSWKRKKVGKINSYTSYIFLSNHLLRCTLYNIQFLKCLHPFHIKIIA